MCLKNTNVAQIIVNSKRDIANDIKTNQILLNISAILIEIVIKKPQKWTKENENLKT